MNFLEQIIQFFLDLFQSWGGKPTQTITYPDDSSSSPITSTRHAVTEPENPTAHFLDTGSGAWTNQWKGLVIDGVNMQGRHGGTDFAAPSGTPVYAPYAMRIIAIGYYPDSGRKGWYVIGTLPDGAEYYSGHLNNIKVQRLQSVDAGTQIGETWDWWGDAGRPHTHIQIKVRGTITDPERYFRTH